uniref:Uncharacterized protein n=1 Tax=Triticum urartu TaxID=4572 RepID=A0A8R7NYA0_TRIUA
MSLRRRDLRAALLIARSPGRCQIQLPGGFLCCGCRFVLSGENIFCLFLILLMWVS